jgi:hypothetical protein
MKIRLPYNSKNEKKAAAGQIAAGMVRGARCRRDQKIDPSLRKKSPE